MYVDMCAICTFCTKHVYSSRCPCPLLPSPSPHYHHPIPPFSVPLTSLPSLPPPPPPPELVMKAEGLTQACRVCLHTAQLVPNWSFRKCEHFELISLLPDALPSRVHFPVKVQATIASVTIGTIDCVL